MLPLSVPKQRAAGKERWLAWAVYGVLVAGFLAYAISLVALALERRASGDVATSASAASLPHSAFVASPPRAPSLSLRAVRACRLPGEAGAVPVSQPGRVWSVFKAHHRCIFDLSENQRFHWQ